jgi:magnesium chelatase subunit D
MALFAVAPSGFGGIRLRAPHGPDRATALSRLQHLLPPGTPWRKLPMNVDEGRLTGGLDLGATLQAGRPVVQRGLLSEADGGIVTVAMAERMPPATAARIAAVLDTGEAVIERDGISHRTSARFGLLLLDEGIGEDEQPPAALLDRIAFHVGLQPDDEQPPFDAATVAAARDSYRAMALSVEQCAQLAAASLSLGVESVRALGFAARAARAAAALEDAPAVTDDHLALAMRLVFAPRATRLPEGADAPPPDTDTPNPEPESPEAEPVEAPPGEQTSEGPQCGQDTMEVAAQAAVLPQSVLQCVAARGKLSRAFGRAGRVGAAASGSGRGRPAGVMAGMPGRGARLNLLATLRAAAPWQKLRRGAEDERQAGIRVLRDDWRVTRLKHRSETATIFVVDASGSSALHRLGEAKGAVELMLADCYTRRDQVALIAFRGTTAEIALPPTRSLARARRCLAGVPGGGGTPLATAIETAADLALSLRGKGRAPVIVLLSDGRANVSRDGRGDRAQADADAQAAARRLRVADIPTIVIDTATRPGEPSRRFASAAAARYLPLPHADAAAISLAVQDAVRGEIGAGR